MLLPAVFEFPHPVRPDGIAVGNAEQKKGCLARAPLTTLRLEEILQ